VKATFSQAEREAIREARIAIFEDRLILDAQPPIEDEVLSEIGERCEGPLPVDLIALWRTAFGGTLAYDLRATFGDHEASLSFSELFFPDSDGYYDLWGWIEHEEELAQKAADERGEVWSGALAALPFGGFEYLERIYAIVRPGEDHGAVVAWTEGLPPGWMFDLQEDLVTRVSGSVRALFRALVLEADPFSGDELATGVRLAEEIDGLASLGPVGRGAADKLRVLVQRVVLDWRPALADGSIRTNAALRRLAVEHAARKDDVDLLARLASLGCDPCETLRGGWGALEHALACGAMRAARFLLDRGAPATGALSAGARFADPELARELLARGATVDVDAVFSAVDAGRVDTAFILLDVIGSADSLQLAIRARERAADAEQSAKRIEAGTLASDVSAADLRDRARRLGELADRVDPTIRGVR
jgi:hypothetical protein